MDNVTNMDNITNITYTRDPTLEILQSSRFWIQRVFVPLMVCIGIAGNTITVMVLTRRRMRSSTNIYLSALAIADIIYLFFVFVLSFTHSDINDIKYELYWRFYGLSHWLCDAASNTSVWLTVSFTIERYIAVCHPMKRKLFCTENRAKTVIVVVYIFCTITVASTAFENQLNLNETCSQCPIPRSVTITGNAYNISNSTQDIFQNYIYLDTQRSSNESLFVQYANDSKLQKFLKSLMSNCTNSKHVHVIFVFPNVVNNATNNGNLLDSDITKRIVVPHGSEESVLERPQGSENTTDLDDDSFLNQTVKCRCSSTVGVELTSLGKNKTYKTFINWYSALVFALIPLTLIATFNCLLVKAVYLSQRQRKAMTNNQDDPSNTNISNENRITIMLISVVVMFLICQTPTAFLLIYENFISDTEMTVHRMRIHYILGNFFNFLLTINASCNFLLYSTMSKKFRTTFKKLFFERGKNRQDTIVLSSTRSRNSQKFNPYKHGIRRNASEYHTPRNLETQSLTGMPRSQSLMTRPMGKAKSSDVVF